MKPTAKEALISLAKAIGYEDVQDFLIEMSPDEIKGGEVDIYRNTRCFNACIPMKDILKELEEFSLKDKFSFLLEEDGFEFNWAESTNDNLSLFGDLNWSFDEDSITWWTNPRPEDSILIERLQEASKKNQIKFWEIVIANKDRLVVYIEPNNTSVQIFDNVYFKKVFIHHLGYFYSVQALLKGIGIRCELVFYSNDKIKIKNDDKNI